MARSKQDITFNTPVNLANYEIETRLKKLVSLTSHRSVHIEEATRREVAATLARRIVEYNPAKHKQKQGLEDLTQRIKRRISLEDELFNESDPEPDKDT